MGWKQTRKIGVVNPFKDSAVSDLERVSLAELMELVVKATSEAKQQSAEACSA